MPTFEIIGVSLIAAVVLSVVLVVLSIRMRNNLSASVESAVSNTFTSIVRPMFESNRKEISDIHEEVITQCQGLISTAFDEYRRRTDLRIAEFQEQISKCQHSINQYEGDRVRRGDTVEQLALASADREKALTVKNDVVAAQAAIKAMQEAIGDTYQRVLAAFDEADHVGVTYQVMRLLGEKLVQLANEQDPR